MNTVNGPFDYRDPSFGNDSSCHLRVYQFLSAGIAVAIATELRENRGPSITNSAESLWREVVKEYDLDPEKTHFVEHYRDDVYDFVSFDWIDGYPIKPNWRHGTKEEIEKLIGEKLS